MPVLLREYNKRWAVIAFDYNKMEYQNFAIDRIEKEEYSSKNLMGDSTFDAHSHFSHDIGNSVTKDTPKHKIKFKIEKKKEPFI